MLKCAGFVLLGAVLCVGPSSAGAQEKIDGQYLVVLKPGAAKERVTERARERGGRVQRSYRRGFSARLDRRALRVVEADPAVEFVEPDRVVDAAALPWGLDRI